MWKYLGLFYVAGFSMPMRELLDGYAGPFSPEDVTALSTAFERSLEALQLRDRSDPLVLMVASRIIELFKHGERNAVRLCNFVVDEFQVGAR